MPAPQVAMPKSIVPPAKIELSEVATLEITGRFPTVGELRQFVLSMDGFDDDAEINVKSWNDSRDGGSGQFVSLEATSKK